MTKKYFIFLILIATFGFLYNYDKFLPDDLIQEVIIESNIINSNKKTLNQVINKTIGKQAYKIDLRQIKKELEIDPWIKNTQVTLKPPDIIIINIKEYDPIFLWNNLVYVDLEGNLIKSEELILDDILEINSNIGSAIENYNNYLIIQEILDSIELNINKISRNNDVMTIDTGKYLFKLRFSQYKPKLYDFVSIYNQFINSQKNNSSKQIIDLRYSTGFAVQ